MDVGPALNQLANTFSHVCGWKFSSSNMEYRISTSYGDCYIHFSAWTTIIYGGIGIDSADYKWHINWNTNAVRECDAVNRTISHRDTRTITNATSKGVDFVVNIANGILQNLPQIIVMAGRIITYFANTIISSLPTILSTGASLLLRFVNGIINNLPQIVRAAATAIVRFVASIGMNLPQILQSGITIIGKLAAGLLELYRI